VKGKVKVDTFKTAMDILKDKNMSGKVVIITGANSGIGKLLVCVFSLLTVAIQMLIPTITS
jgi:NADPH:quinone reductase-like Zn-dependent oxidoreductase